MKPTVELAGIAPTKHPSYRPAWLKEVDQLLRGESGSRQELSSERLQIGIILLGLTYGLCMGTYALMQGDSSAVLQLLSGMVKVPALFLLTLLVTFPSLYVFNALVGCRLSMPALWRLLTSSVALNMAVLASFGPIVAFFSLSTSSYSFMLLLNVAVFAVAGALGLRYLVQKLHELTRETASGTAAPPLIEAEDGNGAKPAISPAPGSQVRFVFRCWIVVFALVGAQMSWLLRPFLGGPNLPFSFFRGRESNFFEAVWSHLIHLFS